MTLQQEIIQALGAKPQIDVAGEIRRSVDFLKSYLQTYPFIKSLVLGISGGQDSTLTGKLCQIAINELRAETGDLWITLNADLTGGANRIELVP